jgi:hypothetical protein
MYAVVGFASPRAIFTSVSSLARIVQSASPVPSATVTVPSSTLTVHWPTSSMSKTYVLCIPAVFAASALSGSAAKNSCAVMRLVSSLTDGSTGLLPG